MDWYPDPADPTRERYWDGQQWTHNTRAQKTLPTPQPQTLPQQSPWQPQPQGAWQQQPQWTAAESQTPDVMPLASWWQRVAAHVLDTMMITFLLNLLLGHWSQRFSNAYAQFMDDYLLAIEQGTAAPSVGGYDLVGPASVVVAAQAVLTLVYVVAMLRWRGATVGKMIMGLRVVPQDDALSTRLSWRVAIVRGLVFVACLMTSIFFVLSALMSLGTRRRQTWHDMAARTVVVRGRR